MILGNIDYDNSYLLQGHNGHGLPSQRNIAHVKILSYFFDLVAGFRNENPYPEFESNSQQEATYNSSKRQFSN